MKIWAIADLHLSFGVPGKEMDIFGPAWKDHARRTEAHWRELISPDDLILIPGDISWAVKFQDALPDLEWIDRLPGTKLLLKGNHDFWWSSLKQMVPQLPPSIHLIQNNSFLWKGVAIGGSRLWDTPEYSFGDYIEFQENSRQNDLIQTELGEGIFERELHRLRLSLNTLAPTAPVRIAMTHYPPIGTDLKPSQASKILEEFRIQHCVFGHLHALKSDTKLFNKSLNGIHYHLVAGDYLHFKPTLITTAQM